jgi:plastocyanin
MTTMTVSKDHTNEFAPAETTVSPGGTIKFNSADKDGVTFYTYIGRGDTTSVVFVGQKADGSMFAPHGEPASYQLLPEYVGTTIEMTVTKRDKPIGGEATDIDERASGGAVNGKINVGSDGGYTTPP